MSAMEFTEDMNEVTGLHGYYERCCRAAVVAGASWCLGHPGPADPAEVERAIRAAPITTDDGRKVTLDDELTGTQLYTALCHVKYISLHGWNVYREHMSEPMAVYEDDVTQPENANESAV
jgi:hypothetical protein